MKNIEEKKIDRIKIHAVFRDLWRFDVWYYSFFILFSPASVKYPLFLSASTDYSVYVLVLYLCLEFLKE